MLQSTKIPEVPDMHDQHVNIAADVAKLAPGGVYIGATVAGISVQDWVAILTGVYIFAQMILLIPKYLEWFKQWRSKHD